MFGFLADKYEKLDKKRRIDVSFNAPITLSSGETVNLFQTGGYAMKDYLFNGSYILSIYDKDKKRIDRQLKIKGIKAFKI